jgi:hypothetical protein
MGKVLYTDEMKEWLIQNYSDLGSVKATKMFNEKFGTNKNNRALRSYCLTTLGLNVSDKAISNVNSLYEYDDKFILENRDNYSNDTEFYRAYVEHTGDNVSRSAFRYHLKVVLNLGGSPITWTDEQIQWIKKNYSKFTYTEARRAFNKKFHTDRSAGAIASKANRLGCSSRMSPADDGTVVYPKSNSDRARIKIDGKWRKLSHYVYEQHHGRIPKGYSIIYLDNDPNNCDISNLCAVPHRYIAILNGYNLKSEFPEITKTGIMWCQLYDLLKLRRTDLEKEK